MFIVALYRDENVCTNFLVGDTTPGFVNGRSMEFASDLKSRLYFQAAGRHFSAQGFGDYQFEWQGQHNVVGMNTHGLPVLTDGMNDKGLATGDLWLPGSKYQKITDKKKGLSIDRFAAWLLSSFATVEEVRKAMKDGVVEVGAPVFVQNVLPLHFPVHDASGDSIVIEFTGGDALVYDNPVGTLTNQPPFPWQLENIRNYVNLTPRDIEPMNINGMEFSPTGHGAGLLGLPSDPTPPSRFVKAALSAHFAEPFTTMDEGVTLAFHILNSVDIPKGMNRFHDSNTGKTCSDYTQWVVVKDLERKGYYVRDYVSPQVYSVDLTKIDWQAMDGKQIDIPTVPISIDLGAGLDGGLVENAFEAESLRVLAPSGDPG
ncbi:MAG: linear amide C-N hydrolase [Nisaea sp.]|uniref:linear amide C-N hydrolase n=1 Tax=Nisaea sp. TaxID=2024842 RepID=UPI003298518C